MTRRAMWLWCLMVAALVGGCATDAHDAIMEGTPNAVAISYAGDLSDTAPLARQYCARYERVPVFLRSADNRAYYYCLAPGQGAPKGS